MKKTHTKVIIILKRLRNKIVSLMVNFIINTVILRPFSIFGFFFGIVLTGLKEGFCDWNAFYMLHKKEQAKQSPLLLPEMKFDTKK